MMILEAAGYREVEHTADWELEVWAADLPGLFEQAARGMCALAGMRLQPEPRHSRRVSLQARDIESLLVSFLSELLYYLEQEGIGFDLYQITLEGLNLQAELGGARLASIQKEIKAVTFHRLSVRQTEAGLKVNIVFDV
jgi:SHS2 domain-containing protein